MPRRPIVTTARQAQRTLDRLLEPIDVPGLGRMSRLAAASKRAQEFAAGPASARLDGSRGSGEHGGPGQPDTDDLAALEAAARKVDRAVDELFVQVGKALGVSASPDARQYASTLAAAAPIAHDPDACQNHARIRVWRPAHGKATDLGGHLDHAQRLCRDCTGYAAISAQVGRKPVLPSRSALEHERDNGSWPTAYQQRTAR